MNQSVVRDRYKSYRVTLMGKQLADQYTRIFNGDNNKNHKYINAFLEQGNFWVANITSIKLRDNNEYHSLSVMCSNEYRVVGGLSYSLYMHKYKDLAVLKVPILAKTYNNNVDNNIRWYFGKILHKLGYNKYVFDIKKMSTLMGGYELQNYKYDASVVKILIPPEKTEDDLIKLIGIIEQLNVYISNNSPDVWDNHNSIEKANIINM